MPGPSADRAGEGHGVGGCGDSNIDIDINMNIDIHIIINVIDPKLHLGVQQDFRLPFFDMPFWKSSVFDIFG